MTELKSSEAELKAAKNYRKRNSGRARFPGTYLTEEEARLLDDAAEVHGTKHAAIIAGLRLLMDK